MVERGRGIGFAWSEPHHVAERHVRALFAAGTAVVALYLVTPLVVIFVVVAGADGLFDTAGAVALTVVAGVGAFAIVMVACRAVAWRGLTRRMLRLTGARAPAPEEVVRLERALAPVSVGRGIAPPTTWIVDDGAVNALVLGQGTAGDVVLTSAALGLPEHELEALCAHAAAALTNPLFLHAAATVDVILLGERLTRLLWTTAVLGFLTTLVGVPVPVGAAYVLGIIALVVVTRPVLMIADRTLPPLLDDASEMIDLDAVRLTGAPVAYGQLLERIRSARSAVCSPWELAHRWFERESVERKRLVPYSFEIPPLARACERADGRSLEDRIRCAVDQAGMPIPMPRPRPDPKRSRRSRSH